MSETEQEHPLLAPQEDDIEWPADAWPATIQDVEQALEWAADAQAEIAELEEAAAAVHRAVDERLEAASRMARRRLARLEERLELWTRGNLDQVVRGRKKSRSFLHGTIAVRAQRERVVVVDEAQLLDWAAEEHLELVRVKREVDKKALDALVMSTGEIPPGVNVEPAKENVLITPHGLPALNAPKVPQELP